MIKDPMLYLSKQLVTMILRITLLMYDMTPSRRPPGTQDDPSSFFV